MNELSMHRSKVNFVIFCKAWFSNICWVTLPADITVCFGVTAVETHDTRLFSLFLKCSKIKGEKIYIWTYLPMRTSMKASMEIWEELVKFIQQKMEQVLPVVVSSCIFFFTLRLGREKCQYCVDTNCCLEYLYKCTPLPSWYPGLT